MNEIYRAFKDYLLSFNYSNKVRFIIFLVLYSVLCLQILQYQYHTIISRELEMQREGVNQFKNLNLVFNKIILFLFTDIDALKNELALTESDFDRFYSSFHLLLSKLKKDESIDPELLTKLQSHVNVGTEYWRGLKQNIASLSPQEIRETLSFSIDNFLQIILYLSQVYRLDISLDIADYFLGQIFSYKYPKIQTALSNLYRFNSMGELNNQSVIQKKMALFSLKNDNEKVISHFNAALASNDLLKNSVPNGIAPYLTYSKKLNKTVLALDKDINIGRLEFEELVKEAFQLQEQTIQYYIALVEQQFSLIYWRKLLSTLYASSGPFIVLAFYMTRIVRRPIFELKLAAEKLSQGDLTVRIPIQTKDEVSQVSEGFNKMLAFFEQIMRNAQKISTVLVQTTSAIFSNSKELELNVTEQEKAIKRILNNTKGVTKAVQDFSEFLKHANQSAMETANLANRGKEALEYMDLVMHQIDTASNRAVETLKELQERITAIQGIINTLVKIADQINLLSLNSAIRAGKQAKQFPGHAVIADKIRELADQTAFLTLNMEESVNDILNTVSNTVETVVSFSTNIQHLILEASQIKERLKKIIDYSKSQVESFESIYTEMQKQVESVGKIEHTMVKMTSSAHQTTTSVRNLYVEIEYLYHSTYNLQGMTKQFLQAPDTPSDSDHQIKT